MSASELLQLSHVRLSKVAKLVLVTCTPYSWLALVDCGTCMICLRFQAWTLTRLQLSKVTFAAESIDNSESIDAIVASTPARIAYVTANKES